MPNDENPDLIPPVSGEAMDIMKAGYQLQRAEADAMVSLAVKRPREMKDVMRRVLGEIKLIPEFVAAYRYSIPFKGGRDGKDTRVEGLSIKAATCLARNWGNCACMVRILDYREEGVQLTGRVLDYETGVTFESPFYVSRFAKSYGTFKKLEENRWLQAIQSGASKAMRNAILKLIPEPMQIKMMNEIKRVIVKGFDPVKKAPEILKAFAVFGVDQAQLEFYIGRKLVAMEGPHYEDLIGLYSALKDGELTVAEAFSGGKKEEPEEKKKGEEEEIQVEDLESGGEEEKEKKAKSKKKAKPKPPPEEPETEPESEPKEPAETGDEEPTDLWDDLGLETE